jgi:hypothetical protein
LSPRPPSNSWRRLAQIKLFRIALLVLAASPAIARDNGRYAQVDPKIRQWFRNQLSPKTGGNCCNEADGVYAEEDIRGEHYCWPDPPFPG